MAHCVSCQHDLGHHDHFCASCGRRVGGPSELTWTCALLATGILAIWTTLMGVSYASQWAMSSMATLYFPFLVLATVGCAGPALRRAGTSWGAANILTLLLLLLAAGSSFADWGYITTGVAVVAAVLHVTGILAARRQGSSTIAADRPVAPPVGRHPSEQGVADAADRARVAAERRLVR